MYYLQWYLYFIYYILNKICRIIKIKYKISLKMCMYNIS
uniref:Uncharacterized protein n=1 Tax=Manihot esculenta TaxID=3983 RepID=A0A199UA47_MANES